MSRKFLHRWALEYGPGRGTATSITNMRMAFKSQQSTKGANTCDVTIWMPSRELIVALADPDTVVRVLAGYQDGGAVELCQGGVVDDSLKHRPTVADPFVSWKISPTKAPLARATVSKSWPSVHASEAIEFIRQAMGVPKDTIELPDDVFYARGLTIEGGPKTYLDEIVADCGAQWALPDGRLRVWPIGGVAQTTAELWSAKTGLIESASPSAAGKVSARALLSPRLRPGDLVRMFDPPRWFGDIRVEECTHTGDTHGTAVWETAIKGVVGG